MTLPSVKTEHQIGITIIVLLIVDVALQYLMLRALQGDRDDSGHQRSGLG